MRRLIALVLVAAALWAGYWFVAARAVEAGITAWLASQQAAGWQIGHEGLRVRGFPNRLDTTIDAVSITAPDRRTVWRAPFFQILALSYRPNHIIALWPHTQSLSAPFGTFAITSTDMRASAVFKAKPDLALDHANAVIDGLEIRASAGWQMQIANTRVALRQAPGNTGDQELGVEISDADLPAELRARAGLAPDAPGVVQKFRLTAELHFDKPLDRFALSGDAPQIDAVTLTSVQIGWGDMTLSANGAIRVGTRGEMSGEMTLTATNWQHALALLPDQGGFAARAGPVLGALTQGDGALNLTLSLRDGLIFAGPVPLGPAPVLPLIYRQ